MITRRILHIAAAAVLAVAMSLTLTATASAADLPARILDNANIRSAPQPRATIIGQGALSHRITIHCYVTGGRPADEGFGNPTNLWWYLTDNTTHRTGYVWATLARPTSDGPRTKC